MGSIIRVDSSVDILLKKAGVGATLIVVNNLMPVLMGIFTGWFEKWYPARLARGSKKQ